MFIHDLYALSKASEIESANPAAPSKYVEFNSETPMVALLFPKSDVVDTKTGITNDSMEGTVPYLSLVDKFIKATEDEKIKEEMSGMMNQVRKEGKTLTIQQKKRIFELAQDEFNTPMGYPFMDTQGKVDYPFDYPNMPYPTHANTPETFRNMIFKAMQGTDGDRPHSLVASAVLSLIPQDDTALYSSLFNSQYPFMERLGMFSPMRPHMPTLLKFSEKGWFDEDPMKADYMDVVRLDMTKHKLAIKVPVSPTATDANEPTSLTFMDGLHHAYKELADVMIDDKIFAENIGAVVFLPTTVENLAFGAAIDPKEYVTEDLKDIEIMAVGEFVESHGIKVAVTEDMLDSAAKNFNELAATIKPPLKLGHKPFTDPAQNGYPAFGWLTRVYKKGIKLFADISAVPKQLADLVKVSAYRRVSSELKKLKRANGKSESYITALALLGADIPAIKTLADVAPLYRPADVAFAEYCGEFEECEDVQVHLFGEVEAQIAIYDKGYEMLEAVVRFFESMQRVALSGENTDTEKQSRGRVLLSDLHSAVNRIADSVLLTFSEDDDIETITKTVNDTTPKGGATMEKLFEFLQNKYKANPVVAAMTFSDVNLKTLQDMDTDTIVNATVLATENANLKATFAEQAAIEATNRITGATEALIVSGKLKPALKTQFLALCEALEGSELTFAEVKDGKTIETKIGGFQTLVDVFDKADVHAAFKPVKKGTKDSDFSELTGTSKEATYEDGKAVALEINKSRGLVK